MNRWLSVGNSYIYDMQLIIGGRCDILCHLDRSSHLSKSAIVELFASSILSSSSSLWICLSLIKEYRNLFRPSTERILDLAAFRANSCNFVFSISVFLITLFNIFSALILTWRAIIGLLPDVDIATCIIPSILIMDAYEKSLCEGSSTEYTKAPRERPFSTSFLFNNLFSVHASKR